MTGKKIILPLLTVVFIVTSFTSEYEEIAKIKAITASPTFTIGIERFDKSYPSTADYYFFSNSDKKVTVLQSHRIIGKVDTVLNNIALNNSVLDSLSIILTDIKSIQLKSPKKFKKQFKKAIGSTFDIIYVFNQGTYSVETR